MSHHKRRVYPQVQVPYATSVPVVAEQQQVQQQIDQTAYTMGNVQLNDNAYSFTQPMSNNQYPAAGKVVNQLYLSLIHI